MRKVGWKALRLSHLVGMLSWQCKSETWSEHESGEGERVQGGAWRPAMAAVLGGAWAGRDGRKSMYGRIKGSISNVSNVCVAHQRRRFFQKNAYA